MTHRGIIAQRLGQPLIHLIQHSNKPQLHSNYYLAETAARTRSHLWCWCKHKRDNKAVVHSRCKHPWLLKGNRGYLLIFIWRVWRDIWVGFFFLNKQKSNKNAKNLGITVTTNTDKKQQNKEKKKPSCSPEVKADCSVSAVKCPSQPNLVGFIYFTLTC